MSNTTSEKQHVQRGTGQISLRISPGPMGAGAYPSRLILGSWHKGWALNRTLVTLPRAAA